MNYLLRNNTKESFPIKKIVALVFVCISLIAVRVYKPMLFQSAVQKILYPVVVLRNSLYGSVSWSGQFMSLQKTLIAKNKTLEEENYALRTKDVERELIVHENEQLRTALGMKENDFVVARIVSKPPFTPFDSFLIEQKDNVALGDLVYIAPRTIIGTVDYLSPSHIEVTLFSSSGFIREGRVTRSGASVRVSGASSGTYEISLPKDFDIVVGDEITDLASGDLLGSVLSIDTQSSGSFKTVFVRLPYNVFSSEVVYIKKR